MASLMVKRLIASTGVVAAATFGVVASTGAAFADDGGGKDGSYSHEDGYTSDTSDSYGHDDTYKSDGKDDSYKSDGKDDSYSSGAAGKDSYSHTDDSSYSGSSYPRSVPAGTGGAAATTDGGTQALQIALGAGGVVLVAGGAVLMLRRREAEN